MILVLRHVARAMLVCIRYVVCALSSAMVCVLRVQCEQCKKCEQCEQCKVCYLCVLVGNMFDMYAS